MRVLLVLMLACSPVLAQESYTRYELLDPSSQSFRIIYDVTTSTPGARYFYNPIRKGSTPTVHGVTDRFSGKPLSWKLVSGTEAAPRLKNADPEMQYIEVELARPVPNGGETRLRIDKTYRDPASYTVDGDRLVFERGLGIPRNSVVLPKGYELIGCSMPSQVAPMSETDLRIKISFLNRNPGAAPLRVEARKLPKPRSSPSSADPSSAAAASGTVEVRPETTTRVPASARLDYEWTERAFQDREIVYFLQPPETHSFRLYHDYTETRPGMDRYINVVRPGSRASNPSALLLDTGEALKVETLRGAAIAERGIDLGEAPTADTEVVAIWFEPVVKGQSKRLRIEETYTDPGRYGLDGDELIWDRSFGRSTNTVLLPAGWWLTESSIPAVVDLSDDGRVRLLFENDRGDGIDVYLRARRR